jgi:hypothetical protein
MQTHYRHRQEKLTGTAPVVTMLVQTILPVNCNARRTESNWVYGKIERQGPSEVENCPPYAKVLT